MAIGPDLAAALASLAATERDIVTVGQRVDGDIAADLVRARRDLVLAFAALGAALEQDPDLNGHADRMTEGTRLFSAFRSANAINQANWPAIRVRDDRQTYRGALQPLVERSRAFWDWVERDLGFRR